MTPEEVNETVALKLGWEKVVGPAPMHRTIWIRKGNYGEGQQYAPTYTTDIKSAWEIVERVFTSFYLLWDETTGTWFAKWDNQHRTEESCRYKAEADTAPMAICLAYLKMPKES